MEKILLFSVTKKDFKLEFFRCGGNGGQNQNKVSSGVRIRHLASGAVAECREEREQLQNKKKAFKKLVQTPVFQRWYKIQCAKALGIAIDVDKWVDQQMDPQNLKIEVRKDDKWVEVKPEDLYDYETLPEE